VILLNHNHGDQIRRRGLFQEKSGAQVMAVFAKFRFSNTVACFIAPVAGGPGGYPPVKVDRALFDGDVIKWVADGDGISCAGA